MPVIGVIPLYDEKKESYWMLPGYMKMLEAFGALPIMLPLTGDRALLDKAVSMCDGLLLTGGHDVSPEVYGAEKMAYCGGICKERDDMEAYLLDWAIKLDMPVLGICRGIQFMNAHLGGTLYQDLESEYDSEINHHMKPPYDAVQHNVNVLGGTLLSNIIGEGLHGVNSYHHQAVKSLSDRAEIMAYSEDGLIEAISIKGCRFAVGVQWHPEFSFLVNDDSKSLVKAFVEACVNTDTRPM